MNEETKRSAAVGRWDGRLAWAAFITFLFACGTAAVCLGSLLEPERPRHGLSLADRLLPWRKRARCPSGMKQIGLALQLYANTFEAFPVDAGVSGGPADGEAQEAVDKKHEQQGTEADPSAKTDGDTAVEPPMDAD